MNCAQSGCEISPEAMMEAGAIPRACPTCGHPLRIVVTVEELGELSGLQVEEPAGHDGGEGDGTAPQE